MFRASIDLSSSKKKTRLPLNSVRPGLERLQSIIRPEALRAYVLELCQSNISEFDVSSLYLDLFEPLKLQSLVAFINETSITRLNISSNNLDPEKLLAVSKQLEENQQITHISCQNNLFWLMPALKMEAVISKLSKHRVMVDLSNNQLGKLSVEALLMMSKSLSGSVQALVLSRNHLGRYVRPEILKNFLSYLKAIYELDLSNNELHLSLNDEFDNILRYLPTNLQSLSLSGNKLFHISPPTLIKVMQALPANVTFFDISGNQLGQLSSVDFNAVISGLHPQLTTLDLSDNGLHMHGLEYFERIILALPSNIRTVILKKNHLNQLGSVNEVGDILMKSSRNFVLGDTVFANKLSAYINASPFLTLYKIGKNRFFQPSKENQKPSLPRLCPDAIYSINQFLPKIHISSSD